MYSQELRVNHDLANKASKELMFGYIKQSLQGGCTKTDGQVADKGLAENDGSDSVELFAGSSKREQSLVVEVMHNSGDEFFWQLRQG